MRAVFLLEEEDSSSAAVLQCVGKFLSAHSGSLPPKLLVLHVNIRLLH